jgi:ADP-ribose pyrophosphatase YjhB (NUDIX family)
MVSAIVHHSRENQREVLIGKIPSQPYAGKWAFPTGPVQEGEVPEAGLRRVLRDLLDLNVQINFGQPPFDHPWEHSVCRWRFYFCEALEGPTNNRYFQEVRWVPRGALREYDFDPVSQQVVNWLLAEERPTE